MAKIILVCGKICSGKSYYSKNLKKKENAVILSCDEITGVLFDNNLGNKHDEMCMRIKNYLLKKAEDIISTNTNVILDWGFWTKNERHEIKEYFNLKGIKCEMHYINIDYKSWAKNIAERNQRVLNGTSANDYYLDEGLISKLLTKWQEPSKDEVNVWYNLTRKDELLLNNKTN